MHTKTWANYTESKENKQGKFVLNDDSLNMLEIAVDLV